MPNIPPLALSVAKHKYFAALVLFLVWVAIISLMPTQIQQVINSALAGWLVGTEIYKLSKKWEKRFEA